MEATIKVKDLNKKYEGFELKNISFEIPEGSIVGLIGENGAGKTTTIKSTLNIIRSEGEIQVFGKDIKQNEKEIKSKLGVVLDDSFLSEYLTPKKINSIVYFFDTFSVSSNSIVILVIWYYSSLLFNEIIDLDLSVVITLKYIMNQNIFCNIY